MQNVDRRGRRAPRWLGLAALACAALVAACNSAQGGEPARAIPGANADNGKRLITGFGCGSCHVIPGIDGANGMVGPPLTSFGRRVYIAGEVPNTADRLEQWIEVPQSIEPGTDMPNLGVTQDQARDIAAYLYTLR